MKKPNKIEWPTPEEKVCYNCQHLAWAIGVGQGLRCIHPKTGLNSVMIPSSRHTCNDFVKNKKLDNEKGNN